MRGKPCPIPVVEAKKAVKSGASEVVLLVDNPEAAQNLKKYATDAGLSYSLISDQNLYTVTLAIVETQADTRAAEPEIPVRKPEEQRCGHREKGPVVVIGGDTMGRGDEALGRILVKSFIYSLTVLEPQPECIIFFNSGVLLPTGDSAAADLKTLESHGAEILACGACCNHFGVADKLRAGRITDMSTIMERMAKAERLINI
jgi:selenium metabolism protein YedF